jgi:hypothetical protein
MAFSSLFRKKTVQDILKQIEKMKLMGITWQTFNGQDLTAFGIAASGCWYFSTIGKASSDGGPAVIFLFYLRRLPVVLLPLLMPSLRQWFLFQEVHTRIPMLPWGINGWIIGWA